MREAVYLADRVVVMSARPGRIKQIVPTGAPPGDRADYARTADFTATVDLLWNLVRDEAMRAERPT